jgi:hypothetical protein
MKCPDRFGENPFGPDSWVMVETVPGQFDVDL